MHCIYHNLDNIYSATGKNELLSDLIWLKWKAHFVSALRVTEDNLVHTIPVLQSTWKISFDIKLTEIPTVWCNFLHFTNGNCDVGIGCRTPSFHIQPHTRKIEVTYRYVAGVGNIFRLFEIPLNSYVTVLATHAVSLTNSNQHIFSIHLDGSLVHQWTDPSPIEHQNILVYASRPNVYVAPVYIKNFWFVNGVE